MASGLATDPPLKRLFSRKTDGTRPFLALWLELLNFACHNKIFPWRTSFGGSIGARFPFTDQPATWPRCQLLVVLHSEAGLVPLPPWAITQTAAPPLHSPRRRMRSGVLVGGGCDGAEQV
jgi:hypothetical protein